jgi:thiamine-monophosphate kinase
MLFYRFGQIIFPMALNEFQLIQQYFTNSSLVPTPVASSIAVGIGDDGAVLDVPGDKQLVVVMDTLVAGVHFPLEADPEAIGYRALAVNLSDLAAMGAQPLWFTLALTLPEVDESWLAGFSGGLATLAQQYGIALVGGDTTRGPLTITVQAHGFVEQGKALMRNGAQPGDKLYLTGNPGEAAAGLALQQGRLLVSEPAKTALQDRFYYPRPRLALGKALVGIASSAIDISDGLLADIGHVCEQSAVSASICLDKLPLSKDLLAVCDKQDAMRLVLSGGDDYELCFTAPAGCDAQIQELARQTGVACHPIGEISAGEGVVCVDQQGNAVEMNLAGYNHFTV